MKTKLKDLWQELDSYLLIIFVFLLPWQTRYIIWPQYINGGYSEYLSWSIYVTEIILLASGLIFLIKNFAKLPEIFKVNFRLYLSAGVLLGYLLVISFFSQNIGASLVGVLRIFEGLIFLFLIQQNKHYYTEIVWAMVLACLIQANLVYWQVIAQEVIGNKYLGMSSQSIFNQGVAVVENAWGRFLRPYGSLPHPNILALYLGAGIILLQTWFAKNKKYSLAVLASIAVITSALMLTYSRAIILALGLALIIFIIQVIKEKNLHLAKSILVTILTMAVFFFINLGFWQGRVGATSYIENKSVTTRAVEYRQWWNRFLRDFSHGDKGLFFGYGLNLYTYNFFNSANTKTLEYVPGGKTNKNNPNLAVYNFQPIHNYWLLIINEIGLVGLGLLLWLFWEIAKNKKMLPILGFILITSLFDHYFWGMYSGMMIFWLTLAMP